MTMVPSSTGIGAPGTAPAPANLSRSPMSSAPAPQTAQIPFTRGSTLATMKDATLTLNAGTTTQVQLQTNAFLESIILDVTLTATNTAANAVGFASDAPFVVISQIKLDDPAGQSIITPITGYQLMLLNKYLPDTDCAFDPKLDPNYSAPTGTGASGSFSFRLVIPVEHRRRDALGAVNNSAANQRYLVTITTIASYSSTADQAQIYTTAPGVTATTISVQFYQQYWTSPPSTITTANGSAQVAQTPAGLGTVGFVRFEQHNEVSGGGSPQIQLNNVGDYISTLIFVLRDNSTVPVRDGDDWPTEFDWWVNDFQVHALSIKDFQRWMARFYRYTGAGATSSSTDAAAPDAAGGLDIGVFTLNPWMAGLFDRSDNFEPANQYLATDATTKLQIRGSTWGSTAGRLEVITRMIRPVSGAALFA